MNTTTSNPIDAVDWPAQPRTPGLGQRDVDVWAVSLDCLPERLDRLETTLSEDEAVRARRFYFERDRARFIAGRAFLRERLAGYLEARPDELAFAYSPTGKPVLVGAFARSGLNFNLAHTQNLALLAVTRLGPVGVDVEFVRDIPEMDDLVQRFFSPRETVAFRRLPDEEKPGAFYRLWTRKEAWLKAVGEGIAHLLAQVEVSFLPDESTCLWRVPAPYGPVNRWSLWDLQPARGVAAAVSVLSPVPWVRCWSWDLNAGKEMSQ